MHRPQVSGNYYEMGHIYGTDLYKCGFKLSEQPVEKLEFATRSEKEVQRIFPEVLDEIHGLAEACQASYENMLAFLLGIGTFTEEGGCSEFAAFNGTDIVFGRNYDFYYKFKDYTESYVTLPEDAYSSLGHSDIFVGREDGLNENGLAIAISFVGPISIDPGVNFPMAVRCILDKCANVEEAVKVLSNTSFSTTNNYLLADRDGNLAVVEASSGKVRVRRPEADQPYMVATNHFMHPDMLEMEENAKRDPTTAERYSVISTALEQHHGRVDAQAAQKILSSHDGSVCSHMDDIQLGTLWSVIATLRQPQLYRAEGNPCKMEYQLDQRLTLVTGERS